MKMWTFPAGGATTRYVVVAHLDAHSSVALVAPEGFTVARWYSGDEPRVVRGQWISPMGDLRLVLAGEAFELDLADEEWRVEAVAQDWR
jgi:hypothetical protein